MRKKKQLIVLIVTLVSIAGIYLINAGLTPLAQTGEVAGEEDVINYTLPPGYVFSIWGVIYLGFLVCLRNPPPVAVVMYLGLCRMVKFAACPNTRSSLT